MFDSGREKKKKKKKEEEEDEKKKDEEELTAALASIEAHMVPRELNIAAFGVVL